MPVESGVFRKAHKLPLPFTQDHTGCLVCGAEFQHRFEFLLFHPAGSSVGSRLADHKSTLIIVGARELIMELHIQEDASNRSK